jgi:vacuolar-type H+-ATPase subunit E/Vma4
MKFFKTKEKEKPELTLDNFIIHATKGAVETIRDYNNIVESEVGQIANYSREQLESVLKHLENYKTDIIEKNLSCIDFSLKLEFGELTPEQRKEAISKVTSEQSYVSEIKRYNSLKQKIQSQLEAAVV